MLRFGSYWAHSLLYCEKAEVTRTALIGDNVDRVRQVAGGSILKSSEIALVAAVSRATKLNEIAIPYGELLGEDITG